MAGVVFAGMFVRRQRRLASPLLDIGLFASRTFSAALVVLLVGLVGVGGVMLLVTQYLQLVAGLSPLVAGAWMGPPALAMFVAGIVAPLVARRIRPGYVVAGALTLSTVGYLLLAPLDTAPSGIAMVVAGFSLVYLGLGTIAALGTDLVVGAAPADKAGSASAMSETVQELGLALGVATLGSLTTAVYRSVIQVRIPADLPGDVSAAVGDSIWAATSVADRLPGGLLEQAREAFTAGFNVAAIVGAIGILVLAVISAVALRHVAAIGGGKQRAAG